MSRKEKRKHVKEHKHIIHSDAKCIFCGSTKQLQKHHIYPRKFWKGSDNQETVIICDHCHLILHTMLGHLIDVLINRGFMPPLSK